MGELQRVIATLALREITVEYRQRAATPLIGPGDQAALGSVVITRQAILDGQRRRLAGYEDRDLAAELREHLAPLLA